MIPRYSRKILKDIWEDNNKFQIWLDLEILACEAMEKYGYIPKGTTSKIKKKAKFNVKEIEKIEKITKHDVIAFLTNVAKYVGDESRFIHKGLTSSDILDSSFSIQLSQSSNIILLGLKNLNQSLLKISKKYRHTLCIGRSHGIHAETTTFGLKMLGYYEENKRNIQRLQSSIKQIETVQMSGPVGTYSNIDPKIEKYVAQKLKFKIENVSTQIIPRDRHADLFCSFSIIASSLDRLATEIRHLQRTEVLEVEEGFSKGQKGSSAMPHKKNPILSENISGLTRVVRSLVIPALENITSWHERDISHSSVERINAPNATITLDFAVQRMINIIDNLVIHKVNMLNNLNQLKGLPYSQNILIFLVDNKVSREDAYKIVQKCALETWHGNKSFKENLLQDSQLKKLNLSSKIDKVFSNKNLTKNIDLIFKRSLN
ncbi:MAG: adenylosuccinate lyase [Pelagibacteraceae bacterium]|nr:adenylosuccinate lyase [Pelagibacteraceae bacterium]